MLLVLSVPTGKIRGLQYMQQVFAAIIGSMGGAKAGLANNVAVAAGTITRLGPHGRRQHGN